MSSVNRSGFVAEFKGGEINVNDMSADLAKAFEKLEGAGIDRVELAQIAGADGQISGASEWKALFDKIDEGDHNGSGKSFELGEEKEGTRATLMKELRAEVERNRLAGSREGIIHLGMRPESKAEVKALREGVTDKEGGVHSIQGARNQDEIELGSGKDKKSYKLDTATGRDDFCKALIKDGMPAAQATQLKEVLASASGSTRDELAQLGLAFYRNETGDLEANRLVLSGHGFGSGISSDDFIQLKFESIARLAQIFPKGAEKIDHVMLAACSCGHQSQVADLRAMFPNLKSIWAYPDGSPDAESALTRSHMKTWEGRTDGDDPSMVDPPSKQNVKYPVRTWNVADGYLNMPVRVLKEVQDEVAGLKSHADRYRASPPTTPPHDSDLDSYYRRLVELEYHPDLPAADKAAVHAERMKVLELRYPGTSGAAGP